MAPVIRIMCLGDIVGRAGRIAVQELCGQLRRDHDLALVVVNGENASGGTGIVGESADELFAAAVDVITLGDHVWKHAELSPYLERNRNRMLRPANFPPGAPGQGWAVVEHAGARIGIMNLLGRVFIQGALDCPFRKADELLAGPLAGCAPVICDFHAEATSEKIALARYVAGRVSVLVGTHTHVQTADEQILPDGMAYITDLGMCGVQDGVLGMDAQVALKRFVTGLPSGYRLAKGRAVLHGVITTVDLADGKAVAIKRLRVEAAGTE